MITELTWTELNDCLLGCADEAALHSWLGEAADAGRLTYAMRIYSRYGTVRRAREMAELRLRLKSADPSLGEPQARPRTSGQKTRKKTA